MISLLLLLSLAAPQPDFNTQLIHKLVEITRSPTPTKIEIETLSADKMLHLYKEDIFGQCLRSGRDSLTCAAIISSIQSFVFGIWEEEKDPLHLHIYLYEKAGMKVLIHEFMHWRMSILSEPRGIMNEEQIVEALATRIILSSEFQKWLKEVEK